MANPFTTAVIQALNINENADNSALPLWVEQGEGEWPAWFAVTDLACACIGAAAQQIFALQQIASNGHQRVASVTTNNAVNIDRRLASLWFAWSIRPQGWSLPAPGMRWPATTRRAMVG